MNPMYELTPTVIFFIFYSGMIAGIILSYGIRCLTEYIYKRFNNPTIKEEVE